VQSQIRKTSEVASPGRLLQSFSDL